MKLKVMSLNIWRGEVLAAALTFLGQEQPDILLLQEVTNGSNPDLEPRYRLREVLQAALGGRYTHFFSRTALNVSSMEKIEEGNAIFTTLPILNTKTVFFSGKYGEYVDIPPNFPLCPRNLQHITLEVGEESLHVINFHGVWDLDGSNASPARQKMVAAVMSETTDPGHYIIGGDTNAEADNPAMQPLETTFHNVFGRERTTSFNMRRTTNPAYGHVAVDMFYISPGITVLSHASPDVDISDHLPMLLTVEL